MLTNKLRYPDFVCIGSQKAGTPGLNLSLGNTQVYGRRRSRKFNISINCIFRHIGLGFQGIGMSMQPERFWSIYLSFLVGSVRIGAKISELTAVVRDDVSDEWYGRIFAHANEEQKAGEFTPEYALLPEEGVKHLLRLNPEVKIIFLVRDPIDRAWSHMRMLLSHGMNCASDEELAEWVKLADIRDRCDYSATISDVAPLCAPRAILAAQL